MLGHIYCQESQSRGMPAYLRRRLNLLEKRPVGVFQVISYVYSYVPLSCILPAFGYAVDYDQPLLGGEANLNPGQG